MQGILESKFAAHGTEPLELWGGKSGSLKGIGWIQLMNEMNWDHKTYVQNLSVVRFLNDVSGANPIKLFTP